jgi:hypothetical protein
MAYNVLPNIVPINFTLIAFPYSTTDHLYFATINDILSYAHTIFFFYFLNFHVFSCSFLSDCYVLAHLCVCVCVCVCVVLGFDLRAFTLSHSTNPIFMKGFSR